MMFLAVSYTRSLGRKRGVGSRLRWHSLRGALERGLARPGGGRFRGRVVRGKFGEGGLGGPVVLGVADVGLEVLLYDCIHKLSLLVGLGMKSRAEAAADLQALAQPLPQCGGELGSAVWNDAVRLPVEAEDMLNEEVRQAVCVRGGRQGTRWWALVNRLTTTQMASQPCDAGRPMTKSMVMSCQPVGDR